VAAAQDGEKRDVWVTDVGRGTHSRLTFTEDNELAAAWSPSGDVLFAVTLIKGERTIVAHRADGTGQPRTIVKGDFPAVSPDGGFLAYSPLGVQNVPDLSYVALKGDGKPVPFVQTPALENAPQFSPDGRYLVFMSTESGRPEIYVKPFPGGDGKWQVSLNGGGFPRWTQSGDRITFLEIAGNLMEVDVTLRPALTLSTPRLLFPIAAAGVAGGQYDIAPDGKRFLFIRDVANREGRPTPLTLVENWFGEFKNRK
jgi:serine/threonine-protein kinase